MIVNLAAAEVSEPEVADDELFIRTCIHEAAHAAVALFFDLPFDYVTVKATKSSLGTIFRPSMPYGARTRRAEQEVLCHLAGFAAEKLVFSDSIPDGCEDDLLQAMQIVVSYKMNFLDMLEALEKHVDMLMPDIERIAGALVDCKRLSRSDLEHVFFQSKPRLEIVK